jgi:uncharacterized protein
MLKVISNSTPIIALLKIDRLDILESLYEKIIIPEAVNEELCFKDSDLLKSHEFIEIVKVKNIEAKKMYQTALHKGEVEVMMLAQEINADLCIIDDQLARKYAEYIGLKITGTIGIILKAKQKNIINEVKPFVEKMIKNGIYIDEKLKDLILDIANEK